MTHTWRRALLALAGTALVLTAACGSDDETSTATATAGGGAAVAAAAAPTEDPKAGWPEEIRLGFFGGDDAEEVLERVEPMRVYLEETLGRPVTIFTGTSYGAVIEAMRAKRVEGMLVGPFAYVLGVQEAGAEAIAASVSCSSSEDPCVYVDRAPHYFSVIMTKKGNGIETIDDLRGKTFAFVDPASASGHLAPKTYLIKEGVDPDTEMETVFAGSHPTAVLALANDNVLAAATHENNLLNLINEGQVDACFWEDGIANRGTPRTAEEIKATYDACEDGKIVIIGQTAPIPNTPFAVRSDLPESLKTAMKDALLAIKDDPEAVALDRRWFVDPSKELGFESLDQYYNVLRDIAKLLDLDLKELAEG
jgi:phosphonate transport system substrate-binding protein